MKLQNITPSGQARRRYDDACGTAHGLELIGERWALLVVRELLLGPKRFGDLRRDLPGISANVLTQRLGQLEETGIVHRRKLPPPAAVQVYELTAWGYEAEPIVVELGRWAARSAAHDPTLPLSATSLMLSFRTMFDTRRAGDLTTSIGFRLGDETFLTRVERGRLLAARGDADGAAAVITGSPSAVAMSVYAGVAFADAESQGTLRIEGDRKAAHSFAQAFALPSKASRLAGR